MTNNLISSAIEINASPTTVFEHVSQPDLGLRWVPGARSIQLLEGSPGQVGSSTLSTVRLNGKTNRVTETITAAESPHSLISEGRTSAGRLIQNIAIEEIGPQRSKVTISVEVVELAWWASTLSKVVDIDNAAALDMALERLKIAVENPEGIQDPVTKLPVRWSLPIVISYFVAVALVAFLLTRCLGPS